MSAVVKAVSRSAEHTFSKPNEARITLLAGHGVEGEVVGGEAEGVFELVGDRSFEDLRSILEPFLT